MLSETAFDHNDDLELDRTPLLAEMAVVSEWVIRDERDPDDLFTVFVSPTADGSSMQAACSCLRGARDETCPHALRVFRAVREDPQLLNQLFKRNVAA